VRIRSWLLLLLALLQVGVPLIPAVRDNSFTQADRPAEPAIVPAGYTFAIWGLIELLSVGWALWAVLRPDRTTDRLALPLAVVFTGFTLWLLAVTFVEPNWLPLAIFLTMFAGLLTALSRARSEDLDAAGWPTARRWLCRALLGVYTGWTSVAVWANLTTALVGSGAPVDGPAAVAGQLAVLAGAAATAAAIVRWTSGSLPYAGAVIWAFVGVAFGAGGAGQPVLVAVAVLAVVLIGVLTLLQRRTAGHGSLSGVAASGA
jgi:hypothetical protein